jgi:hypothetical protein
MNDGKSAIHVMTLVEKAYGSSKARRTMTM